MKLEPEFVASACAGKWVRGLVSTDFRRVCTDSRSAQEGDLFFALRGDRFDGHTFLREVAKKGVAAAVVDEKKTPVEPASLALLVVEDTRKALGQLALEFRQGFSLPIIAVCGSNGKTTTKELLAAVLRQKFTTLWSDASFNNDIGVPLTLLRLEPTHQAAVLEAGTNHPGELAPLLKMIAPTGGVLTSIGREHLEFFDDLKGVAQEEGMLAEALPEGAELWITADSEWTGRIAERTRAKVTRVGFSDDSDWRALKLQVDRQGVSFEVIAPRSEYGGEYRIQLHGRHQVINALFAVAVGSSLGLSRSEIQKGLAKCKPAKMRLELWESSGVSILDDTYNANADSMVAALQTFQDLPCRGRRIAVLGDMAELGRQSESAHEEVGRRAAELGISQLFAVGKMAAVMARGARGAGLARVFEFTDVDTAANAVKSFVKSGDALLLKASRSTRLERIAECLRANPVNPRNKEIPK